MPAEYVLLSPAMPDDAAFREAAKALDLPVTLRVAGVVAHFVVPERDAVLTVLHPRPLPPSSEIERLLPGHPPLAADLRWWSDLTAPWGAQELALPLAEALAGAVSGVLVDPAALPGE